MLSTYTTTTLLVLYWSCSKLGTGESFIALFYKTNIQKHDKGKFY